MNRVEDRPKAHPLGILGLLQIASVFQRGWHRWGTGAAFATAAAAGSVFSDAIPSASQAATAAKSASGWSWTTWSLSVLAAAWGTSYLYNRYVRGSNAPNHTVIVNITVNGAPSAVQKTPDGVVVNVSKAAAAS
ncbi:MAG TPA: hypothetical protein VLF94_06890 [Chlamydiales bacterium]|nr:hypothetical protein [Chlamydiales bacterium]